LDFLFRKIITINNICMLDKTLKIFTPFMIGYLVGYWERTYKWNKAWNNQFR
jgi:hypothetical protein